MEKKKKTFKAMMIYSPLSVVSFSRTRCVFLNISMCVNDHTYTEREGESGAHTVF